MIILFYLISALLLIFALGTVISTNLVHSSLLMIGAFFGIAGLYLLLHADFLAMVQILVYVGAIAILVVFGVMLTRKGSMIESNLSNRYKWPASITTVGLFCLLVRSILSTTFPATQPSSGASTLLQIAQSLLTDYMVAFEAIGILLLVVIVGAVIIGKESATRETK